jgi:hypothetical protein
VQSGRRASLGLVALLALGCGSAPPPQAPQPEEPDAEAPEPAPEPVQNTGPSHDAEQRPPSTASYDEALASPESLDPNDGRAHLTDLQLANPMRQTTAKCKVSRNAKVVIKVAVQMGRAIGVTVVATFEKPKGPPRRQTPAAARMEAKAAAKIVACVDREVRALTWPPSPRRDSFTTVY